MTPDKAVDLARALIKLALDIVPADVARQVISDEEVRRANAIADTAEDAVIAAGKFGGDSR